MRKLYGLLVMVGVKPKEEVSSSISLEEALRRLYISLGEARIEVRRLQNEADLEQP